jgi:hypothetical protein
MILRSRSPVFVGADHGPADACPPRSGVYAGSMRGLVPPDPETNVSTPNFAVVYMPGRTRKRFPAGCVQVCESRDQAVAQADPAANRFAARVLGPSKSSEGQYLYYLLEWLEAQVPQP